MKNLLSSFPKTILSISRLILTDALRIHLRENWVTAHAHSEEEGELSYQPFTLGHSKYFSQATSPSIKRSVSVRAEQISSKAKTALDPFSLAWSLELPLSLPSGGCIPNDGMQQESAWCNLLASSPFPSSPHSPSFPRQSRERMHCYSLSLFILKRDSPMIFKESS